MSDDADRPGPPPAMLLGALAFAILVTAFRPSRPPTEEEREHSATQKRVLDAWRKHEAQKRRDNDERVAERDAQEAKPEVRAEWLAIAVDRVTAAAETGHFSLRSLGPAGFRGVLRQALLDTVSGDELQVTGGDVADRWAGGSMRVGWHGAKQPFGFIWSRSDREGPRTLSLGQPVSDQYVDLPGLQAAARLFNATPSIWASSPITLQQPKQRYMGPAGRELHRNEKRAFLEVKVDDAFRARGIDPDHGRTYDRDQGRS